MVLVHHMHRICRRHRRRRRSRNWCILDDRAANNKHTEVKLKRWLSTHASFIRLVATRTHTNTHTRTTPTSRLRRRIESIFNTDRSMLIPTCFPSTAHAWSHCGKASTVTHIFINLTAFLLRLWFERTLNFVQHKLQRLFVKQAVRSTRIYSMRSQIRKAQMHVNCACCCK